MQAEMISVEVSMLLGPSSVSGEEIVHGEAVLSAAGMKFTVNVESYTVQMARSPVSYVKSGLARAGIRVIL